MLSAAQVVAKLSQYDIKLVPDPLRVMWSDIVGFRAMQLDEIQTGEAVWGGVLTDT